MPDPVELIYSSPPATPESYAVASSPPRNGGSPITPPSKERPGAGSYISDLEPPSISLNERRRRGVAAAERTINISEEDKYEGKLQSCIKVIQKLQEENNALRQRPGDDYLLGLETYVQALKTENDQLHSENEILRKSEQTTRIKYERSNHHIELLSEQIVKINTAINGDNNQKHNSQIRELQKELKAAREENGELYDRCTILQQENDELKARDEKETEVTDRSKLIRLIKDALVSEEDLITVRKEVIGVSDQLSEKLELRMRREGSMFFDRADFNHESKARTQETEELKHTIKSLQDEIEGLRTVERNYNHSLADSHATSQDSSLETELSGSFDELVNELEFTKDELNRERSYSKSLKEFKEKSEQTNSGDTFDDLDSKIQLMDNLVIEWKKEVKELQLQLELLKARLYEHGVAEDIMATETLAERVQNAIQGCGKMVILSNDIQTINQQAKQDFMTTLERLQGNPDEEAHSQDLYFKANANQHMSNDQPQTRSVVAEWKSSMDDPMDLWERLYSNLFSGVTDEDDDLLWPSSPIPAISTDDGIEGIPRIIGFSSITPSRSARAWMEMICGGKTYWTDIAFKDRIVCVKISGPAWWSHIIQLLTLVLVISLTIAWWCIMTASAERSLWLEANQITIKKYWDTAVWGDERGLLWKIFYGLGYI